MMTILLLVESLVVALGVFWMFWIYTKYGREMLKEDDPYANPYGELAADSEAEMSATAGNPEPNIVQKEIK